MSTLWQWGVAFPLTVDVGGPEWIGSTDSYSLDLNVSVPDLACTGWFWYINLQGTMLRIIFLFCLNCPPPSCYIRFRPRNALTEHYSLDNNKFTALFSSCICLPHPALSSLKPSPHPLLSSLLHLYADGGGRGHCSECKWALSTHPSLPSPLPTPLCSLLLLQLKWNTNNFLE